MTSEKQFDTAIDSVLAQKYPAKAHCRHVAEQLQQQSSTSLEHSLIYLESAHTRMNEDNDQASRFRQRRYFFYLTGCDLPDSAVTYDIGRDKLTLFVPPVDPDEVVWSGMPLQPDEAVKKYDIDAAKTTDEINSFLTESKATAVFGIHKQVSDKITFLSFDKVDMELLKPTIEECRVVKDDYEIALTRRANEITERGHVAVMQAVRTATNERELHAIFLQQCVAHGCTEQAYDPIMATGTDASTLHYVHNNKPITPAQLNILVDAGGELRCYAADVTRTVPVSGTFTPESRAIYDLVLRMQKACMAVLKAGVAWDDVHLLAHRTAVAGLLELGILRGGAGAVDEILEARTSAAFLPHGLGHFLGMDTHDCGGRPNYSDPDPLFRYLRVRRPLPAGSVITVEPGLYFCRFIIEPYLRDPVHAKFIDEKVLDRYWSVGGVRIEDNVLILDDGMRNLTTVPKEIDEIESLVRG